ncbi:hypothetical protein FOA52_015647 [Chlamydomonas sp. UWO 241]|nr:hypothetical protein FOA52_015647 [Chlamydomonas sp. UWO 241]
MADERQRSSQGTSPVSFHRNTSNASPASTSKGGQPSPARSGGVPATVGSSDRRKELINEAWSRGSTSDILNQHLGREGLPPHRASDPSGGHPHGSHSLGGGSGGASCIAGLQLRVPTSELLPTCALSDSAGGAGRAPLPGKLYKAHRSASGSGVTGSRSPSSTSLPSIRPHAPPDRDNSSGSSSSSRPPAQSSSGRADIHIEPGLDGLWHPVDAQATPSPTRQPAVAGAAAGARPAAATRLGGGAAGRESPASGPHPAAGAATASRAASDAALPPSPSRATGAASPAGAAGSAAAGAGIGGAPLPRSPARAATATRELRYLSLALAASREQREGHAQRAAAAGDNAQAAAELEGSEAGGLASPNATRRGQGGGDAGGGGGGGGSDGTAAATLPLPRRERVPGGDTLDLWKGKRLNKLEVHVEQRLHVVRQNPLARMDLQQRVHDYRVEKAGVMAERAAQAELASERREQKTVQFVANRKLQSGVRGAPPPPDPPHALFSTMTGEPLSDSHPLPEAAARYWCGFVRLANNLQVLRARLLAHQAITARRHKAVINIQRIWRGMVARRMVAELRAMPPSGDLPDAANTVLAFIKLASAAHATELFRALLRNKHVLEGTAEWAARHAADLDLVRTIRLKLMMAQWRQVEAAAVEIVKRRQKTDDALGVAGKVAPRVVRGKAAVVVDRVLTPELTPVPEPVKLAVLQVFMKERAGAFTSLIGLWWRDRARFKGNEQKNAMAALQKKLRGMVTANLGLPGGDGENGDDGDSESGDDFVDGGGGGESFGLTGANGGSGGGGGDGGGGGGTGGAGARVVSEGRTSASGSGEAPVSPRRRFPGQRRKRTYLKGSKLKNYEAEMAQMLESKDRAKSGKLAQTQDEVQHSFTLTLLLHRWHNQAQVAQPSTGFVVRTLTKDEVQHSFTLTLLLHRWHNQAQPRIVEGLRSRLASSKADMVEALAFADYMTPDAIAEEARFAADRGQMITIVSAYSPTEAASDEEAGDFYLRVAALADKANDKRDLLIVAGGSQRRAWDSSQLRRPAVRREFNLQLSDRFGLLEAVPPEGADAQAEYDAMAAAIREVATNHLAPRGSRRRRGWQFTLSQRTLRLMDARQRAHTACLRSKSAAAKRERNRANRAADAAVQRDWERWIGQQVVEAQDMLRKKNLRQFARACDRLAGRSRSHQIPPAMRDVSGALHSGPDGVLKAMTESFDKLYGGETKLSDETLNQLENDVAAFELTRATEVDEAHGRPPDLAETEACVRALRSAAAPGG